uniref:Uncharacterized protein n=1 Tax=Oryza nivara TaxID=4536 RepID=A0A0E0FQG1_ORYNI
MYFANGSLAMAGSDGSGTVTARSGDGGPSSTSARDARGWLRPFAATTHEGAPAESRVLAAPREERSAPLTHKSAAVARAVRFQGSSNRNDIRSTGILHLRNAKEPLLKNTELNNTNTELKME